MVSAVPIDAGPGASFFLIELLLGQASSTTVKATCDCTLWVSVHATVPKVLHGVAYICRTGHATASRICMLMKALLSSQLALPGLGF
jgi:hypothetical protein